MQKLINKAIKHYSYNSDLDKNSDIQEFYKRYVFSFNNYKKNKYDFANFYHKLNGNPNCTHIKAKNLLFQGDEDSWKYFERTAVFWTYGHNNDKWIDHLKGAYEYALYVEREDLIKLLFEKSLAYLTDKENLSNKDFKKQKVYPSTQLAHFLIEKWLGNNPVKNLISNYGNGYGVYQKLIDNWDDFSKIEPSYWDNLCECHLNGIGLQRGEKWENEEFLTSGLIPMELINLFKVRKKLDLNIPTINNALFDTNMVKNPVIPTGYNEDLDLKFKLIDLTVKTKKKYTFQEIEEHIKSENGNEVKIFE
ncbi:hypothetical protein KO500_16690 [Cellulophaga baltica]|uniref:hypothetical protein n=1 Tax=Cellulophaga TaxID=104264 RepID=UPI001C071F15|nr:MULTISPECIES: hypothetical protein [Cellulophaga]MBU2998081.1 hypothetical protein [Cellulophaga baltica]MDO6769483.1 hypothetical protein [Cellulophaga sp. 1_MG-2023]